MARNAKGYVLSCESCHREQPSTDWTATAAAPFATKAESVLLNVSLNCIALLLAMVPFGWFSAGYHTMLSLYHE